ncbi:hypothetical protein GF361_00135 [Candidatus Woesearchaeota archaeon]|nr:hypothetical protein [Candidatus Woesearchaeota archaeon]
MPGISEKLKNYSKRVMGYATTGSASDAEYVETKDYQVVAAKILEHEWDTEDYSGGIEWNEFLKIYFKKKDNDEIQEIWTPKVMTRSPYHSKYDKKELWEDNFVYLERTKVNRIKTAWADEYGDTSLIYMINLDDSSLKEHKENKYYD